MHCRLQNSEEFKTWSTIHLHQTLAHRAISTTIDSIHHIVSNTRLLIATNKPRIPFIIIFLVTMLTILPATTYLPSFKSKTITSLNIPTIPSSSVLKRIPRLPVAWHFESVLFRSFSSARSSSSTRKTTDDDTSQTTTTRGTPTAAIIVSNNDRLDGDDAINDKHAVAAEQQRQQQAALLLQQQQQQELERRLRDMHALVQQKQNDILLLQQQLQDSQSAAASTLQQLQEHRQQQTNSALLVTMDKKTMPPSQGMSMIMTSFLGSPVSFTKMDVLILTAESTVLLCSCYVLLLLVRSLQDAKRAEKQYNAARKHHQKMAHRASTRAEQAMASTAAVKHDAPVPSATFRPAPVESGTSVEVTKEDSTDRSVLSGSTAWAPTVIAILHKVTQEATIPTEDGGGEGDTDNKYAADADAAAAAAAGTATKTTPSTSPVEMACLVAERCAELRRRLGDALVRARDAQEGALVDHRERQLAEEKVSEMITENELLKQQLTDSKTALATSAASAESTSNKEKKLAKEVKKLTEKVANVQKERDELSTMASAAAGKEIELAKEVEKLTKSVTEAGKAADAATQEKQKLTKEVKKLSKLVNTTQAECDAWSDAVASAAKKEDKLAKEVEELTRSVTAVEAERDALTAERDELLSAIEQERSAFQVKEAAFSRDAALLGAEKERLTVALAAESAAKRRAEEKVKELEKTIADVELLAESLTAQKESLERELMTVRSTVEALRASRNIEVTAGLAGETRSGMEETIARTTMTAAAAAKAPAAVGDSSSLASYLPDTMHSTTQSNTDPVPPPQTAAATTMTTTTTGAVISRPKVPALPSLAALTAHRTLDTPPLSARSMSLSARAGRIVSLLSSAQQDYDGKEGSTSGMPHPLGNRNIRASAQHRSDARRGNASERERDALLMAKREEFSRPMSARRWQETALVDSNAADALAGGAWTPVASSAPSTARRSRDSGGSTIPSRLARASELIQRVELFLGSTLTDDEGIDDDGEDGHNETDRHHRRERSRPYVDRAVMSGDDADREKLAGAAVERASLSDDARAKVERMAVAVRQACEEVDRLCDGVGAVQRDGKDATAARDSALEAREGVLSALERARETSSSVVELKQRHGELASVARESQRRVESAQLAVEATGSSRGEESENEGERLEAAMALEAAETERKNAADAVYEAERALHAAVTEDLAAREALIRRQGHLHAALRDAMQGAPDEKSPDTVAAMMDEKYWGGMGCAQSTAVGV